MLICKTHKFIFISNPKTGTTTVQNYLLKEMGGCLLNKLPRDDFDSIIFTGIDEHITSKELYKRIGHKYLDYKSFCFIRDPYEKVVSSYFFYKNGKPLTRHDNKRQLYVRINILLTMLPFSIWSLIKPVKKNIDYVLDDNGISLVNYIGNSNKLEEDLSKILKTLNLMKSDVLLNKINKSSHKSHTVYFKNKIHKYFFDLKYRKEILFYELLGEIAVEKNLKGIKLM